MHDVHEYMFEQDWTDGLPVIPPTRDRVNAMLEAAGRPPSEIVGSVSARNRSITVETVAANAVMAGCLPEYFPIVLTVIEAMLDPAFNINTVATSSGGAAVAVVVSGPMALEIGMNSSHNLLGPGNRANATIGRTVRLVISNGLGSKSGKLDASSIGHPGKYTFCFAAKQGDDAWPGLNVEAGYTPEDTVVTILAAEGPRQIGQHLNEDPAGVLRSFAAAMKAPSNTIVGKVAGGRAGQVLAILGFEHELAVREGGWSRDDVREFLVAESRTTPEELLAGGILLETGAVNDMRPGPDGKLPVVSRPEDIILVTAGGPGAGWSALIPGWAPALHSQSITKRVRPVGEALPDCGPDACALPVEFSNLAGKGAENV